ncbi:MAG: hypothetical protein ABIJ56_05905 [Pseudomonadota bacterium]
MKEDSIEIITCTFCRAAGVHPGSRATCTVCGGKGTVTVTGACGTCPACRGWGSPEGSGLPCSECGGMGLL